MEKMEEVKGNRKWSFSIIADPYIWQLLRNSDVDDLDDLIVGIYT